MKRNQHKQYKALRPARLFLWLILLATVFSCKKEKHALVAWTRLDSGTRLDLKSLCRINQSDTLFVCGGKREESGIILRSIDLGKSWQVLYERQGISFNKLYFLNAQQGFALGDYLDIYKTSDGGMTWNKTVFSDTVTYNYRVVLRDIVQLNARLFFVSGGDDFGNGVILKSEDAGEHWTAVITEDHELRSLRFLDSLHGFVCGYGLLMKSNDGGQSWNSTSLSDEFFTGLTFTSSTQGYLCGYNGNLYKTSDAGENWKKLLKGNTLLSSSRNHFTCLDFCSDETGIAAGEQGYALLTEDGGSSWKIASCADKIGIQEIKLESNTKGWAVGDEGSIYAFELH